MRTIVVNGANVIILTGKKKPDKKEEKLIKLFTTFLLHKQI
jgi:hypothetical protein